MTLASIRSRRGPPLLPQRFTLLLVLLFVTLFAPLIFTSLLQVMRLQLKSRAYAAPPVIHVVMRPHLKRFRYRLSRHRDIIIVNAQVVGERGEPIPNTSITLTHQCFASVKTRSDARGYIRSEISLNSKYYQRRGAQCLDLLSALKRVELIRVELKSETWHTEQGDHGMWLGPRLDWLAVIAESSISSRATLEVTAEHQPPLVTLNLQTPQYTPFPSVLPVSLSVPVSVSVSDSSSRSTSSTQPDQSHPPKLPILDTLRARLSISKEMPRGIKGIKNTRDTRRSQTHLKSALEDQTILIPLMSSSERRSPPLMCTWEMSTPGTYRVHLTLHTSSPRDPMRSQSAPLTIYAPLNLSIKPPTIDSARRLVTVSGTLRPAGNVAEALISDIALDRVALGIRWRLVDQEYSLARRADEYSSPKVIQRGQRVMTDQMQLVSPARTGEWSQRFVLPPGQAARFEVTPLSLISSPEETRGGESDSWVALSSPELTDWVEVTASRVSVWLWVLLTVILSERAYALWRRRELSPPPHERSDSQLSEALAVGWMFEHDLEASHASDDPDSIKLVIYNALTREPIFGTILVVSRTSTLEIPLDRSSSLQKSFILGDETMYGLPSQFKSPHDEYSVMSSGVHWSSEEYTHHQGKALWVCSPGFEPLLAALPERSNDGQRGRAWALPLWPAREALGRLLGDMLSELGVRPRYGVGDRAQLTRALKLRGGALLSSFGEEIDLALYSDVEVTMGSLFAYTARMVEIGEALDSELALSHLTPPSDVRRQLISTLADSGEDQS